MDATCAIQDSIHVFSLVLKYVSRILGTYQFLIDALTLYYNNILLLISLVFQNNLCELSSDIIYQLFGFSKYNAVGLYSSGTLSMFFSNIS